MSDEETTAAQHPFEPAGDDPRPLDARAVADLRRRARGCLLGGALGDALGAGLEFLTLASIRASYGREGPDGFVPSHGRRGAITDDTQMTLFTAEGLIRAWVRGATRGTCDPVIVVWHAYLRWLHTQGTPWREAGAPIFTESMPQPDGWLVGEELLHVRRAPGATCLGALASGRSGNFERPINQSKGCGGVMRVAPAGFVEGPMGGDGFGREGTRLEGIFRFGAELAALTHGHPSGYLPAGVLALTLHLVARHGEPLESALDLAQRVLRQWPHHDETARALDRARTLAGYGDPSPERIESLGQGWTGEEALAIGVYAALARPTDPRAALRLAATHGGDSDSTAAICGQLVGTTLGEGMLPTDWLAELEGRDLIARLADDLVDELCGLRPQGTDLVTEPEYSRWWARYPGW